MIAVIITTLICATVVLTAYWLRDLAFRWLDEGRALEDVARLRAQIEAEAESFGAVTDALKGRVDRVESMAVEAGDLARKADASSRDKAVAKALGRG